MTFPLVMRSQACGGTCGGAVHEPDVLYLRARLWL